MGGREQQKQKILQRSFEKNMKKTFSFSDVFGHFFRFLEKD